MPHFACLSTAMARGGARTSTGIHTLTITSRAEFGERLYQPARDSRSRIADAPARAAGSRQPICSARATMMPAGPRR
jgi:hypothetical protein